jgi:translation elongation factor P/translation initiation factor 5A
MNNTRTIKETISQKLEKKDKNGDDYLILKLNNEETIFVFSRKVSEERWNWLEQGKEYNFTVEEGKNGNNLLVDFEIEINT